MTLRWALAAAWGSFTAATLLWLTALYRRGMGR